MFDRLIMPWVKEQKGTLNFVDLCACFGNTTMATVYGMNYDQICENWKDETTCMTIQSQRRFPCKTIGIDISEPASEYIMTSSLVTRVWRNYRRLSSVNSCRYHSFSLCLCCHLHLDLLLRYIHMNLIRSEIRHDIWALRRGTSKHLNCISCSCA